MTVFPARQAVSPPATALPPDAAPTPSLTSRRRPRPRPMDWARRRRAEREARRIEAAGARALNQLDHLGPAWHVVDWPRTDYCRPGASTLSGVPRDERAGFLAIGPSGLFAVTVADHGRSRVLIAGDVVQINGKRPPYVAEARRDAKRAGQGALTAAVGRTVPVTPVLTFVGSGRHQRLRAAQGLPGRHPPGARPPAHRRWRRISPATAEKLSGRRPAPGHLAQRSVPLGCPRLPVVRRRPNGG